MLHFYKFDKTETLFEGLKKRSFVTQYFYPDLLNINSFLFRRHCKFKTFYPGRSTLHNYRWDLLIFI